MPTPITPGDAANVLYAMSLHLTDEESRQFIGFVCERHPKIGHAYYQLLLDLTSEDLEVEIMQLKAEIARLKAGNQREETSQANGRKKILALTKWHARQKRDEAEAELMRSVG
jgi:uncharacterized small protein (DUF1192 family)